MNCWQLKITSPFGNFTSVHSSSETVIDALYAYVAQEWDAGISEQYGPLLFLTRGEAIDAYFDCHGFCADPETYEVTPLTA